MSAVKTCTISAEVTDALKKFRFSNAKTLECLILKIDVDTLVVIPDTQLSATSIEEIAEELPDNTPRFLVLSYPLPGEDGRISFPLIGLFYTPKSASLVCTLPLIPQTLKMLYASSKVQLFNAADIRGQTLELTDAEEFDAAWVENSIQRTRK
jgi:hypothetical protein